MLPRVLALFVAVAFPVSAWAQDSAEVGQMRLYIQQLEQQVRELTGRNEQLAHELAELRAGLPTGAAAPGLPPPQPGLPGQPLATVAPPLDDAGPGAPPQDLGTLPADPNAPLLAPQGPGGPIDLSDLANGNPVDEPDPDIGAPLSEPPEAMPPGAEPAPTASLSGSARDEYDLAYGYILTGDYPLAQKSFTRWLAAFPNDPQAADARFWLGESLFQQRQFREAANTFFAVYQAAPGGKKAPDALLKLGVSLAQIGEKKAACGTLAEVGRRYPQASAALKSRVDAEASRAGCS